MRLLESSFFHRLVSICRRAAFSLMIIALFPLPTLASPPTPDADPSLYILPTDVHPGGQVRVAARGFTPGTWYKVWLALGETAVSPGDAVSVQADANGELRTTLSLPDDLTPGGDYNVMTGVVVGTSEAFTSVGILPAITLSLSPTSGPPGTVVQVTVGNLTKGSLQLDYDGVPLMGPMPVPGTSYSGSFVVPNDRPNPLGSATTVEAFNLVSSLLVGTAETGFQSQAAPTPPTYSFTNVKLPSSKVMPGETFIITGKITPAPKGPLSDYNVVVMWRGNKSTATGTQATTAQLFPISDGPATIQSNGQFAVEAHNPSLVSGDPFASGEDNEIGLVLHTPDGPSSPGLENYEGPPRLTYKIVVRDAVDKKPIEGAKVQVTYDYTDIGDLPESLSVNGPDPASNVNSPDHQLSALGLAIDDAEERMRCEGAETDVQGELEAILSPEQEIVNWMSSADFIESTYNASGLATQGQGAAFQAQEAEIDPWEPPVLSGWYRFRILVDGLNVCYGVPDANNAAQPEVYEKLVWFNEKSGDLRDLNNKPLPVPFEVQLKKLPNSMCSVSIRPVLDHGRLLPDQVRIAGVDGEWPKYGGLVSFADITGVDLTGLRDIKISFTVGEDDIDQVNNPRLRFDTKSLGAFSCADVSVSGEEICYQEDHPDIRYLSCEATIPLNNFVHLPPGEYVARIDFENPEGITIERFLIIEFGSPPAWFQDPNCSDSRAWISYSVVGKGKPGYALQCSLPEREETLAPNIPHAGPQANRAAGSSIRTETLAWGGESHTELVAAVSSRALNSNEVKSQVAGHGAGGPTSGTMTTELPTVIHSILETGWLRIFRMVWGIWPIASATLGTDMWFRAQVQTGGALVIYPNSADTHLCIYPFANIYVHSFFDLSAIFGLAKATASAYPTIGMGMPMHIKNGIKSDNTKEPDAYTYCGFQSNTCFEWLLDVGYYTRVGRCPLCNKKSGIKTVFQGSAPGNCSLPVVEPPRIASTVSVEPVHANPAVATDGFGHTQAIFVDNSTGYLSSVSYDGLDWTDPNTLTANTSAESPQIAYYAPNKAVAVWTESTLSTPAQWGSTTISDAVETMHVVYATYDGSDWSAPANLTTPSGGEGSVALGTCPDGGPGCQSGGQVTAVWLRKVSGDLPDRQFRLYYARFQGTTGTWGSVDPLNPGSTNTETQPKVVYSNGEALVAWVRDNDDLSDSSDRRIATKLLGVHSSVAAPTVLPNLPKNIVDFDMAVDSNGEPHLAFTCIESGGGMVGSRHNLYSAARSVTDWSHHLLKDTNGRVMRAEAPVLTMDNLNRGTITFRGLGFGPQSNGSYIIAPSETVGMITGAGELAQLEVDFEGSAVNPVYLTHDGAVYWQATAAYDALSNSTFALAVQGSPVDGSVVQGLQAGGHLQGTTAASGIQTIAQGSSVVFANVPRLPDFAVAQLTPSTQHPGPGDAPTVKVQVRNDGISFDESPVSIVATWNDGPGVGAPAGQKDLLVWPAGEPQTVTLTLTDPPAGYALVHDLVVTVNHDQSVPEPDTTNNSLSTTMGGLPAPSDVVASVRPGSSMVFLQWTEQENPLVAGYRVYRSAGSGPATSGASVTAGTGEEVPVGSSFVAGFVDFTAESNSSYQYRVVSFSEDGFESEPSNTTEVTLDRWRVRLPFVERHAR